MLNSKLLSVFYVYMASLCSFLMIMILAKYLGETVFSFVSLGLALGGILMGVVNFGMDKTLLKKLHSKTSSVNDVLGQYLTLRLYIFLIIVFIGYVSTFIFDAPGYIYISIGFSIYQILLGLYPKGIFEFNEVIPLQSKIIFIERFTSLLFVASLSILNMFGIITNELFFICVIGCILIIRSFGVYKQYTFFKPSMGFKVNKLIIRNDLSSGSYFLIAFLLNSLLFYSNQLMLPFFGYLKDVSSLAIALQFCLIVQLAQTQIIRFVNNEIMQDKKNRYLNKHLLNSLVLNIPLVTIYLVVVMLMKKFYLTEGYELLMPYSLILSVWLLFLGPGLIINQYIVSNSLQSLYLKLVVIISLLSLFLSYVILKNKLIEYIPLSLTLPHIISMCYQYFLLRKYNKSVNF